jgi:hypothetical protein
MSALAFDTLAFVKKMIRAGMPEAQAEALAELRREIRDVEERLRAEMREIEARLRAEIREVEHRLTLRLGAILAAAVAIVVALVKLL